ncbi:MAG TPA: GNAT family N-acetyltransferase [Rhabdochlamydiaceae bacterium]|nr:GNAT family N-acetyltransferase [Rhabdochlamydiaceae bacterium]
MDIQKFPIEYQDELNSIDEEALYHGINTDAFTAKKMEPIRSFGFFIKDKNGEVLAGVSGVTLFGCLYVDMLWVKETLRKQGLGESLMEHAENLGLKRGCTFATVNTMDWQALPFYQKLGYEIEFTRTGYHKNSKMHYLKKNLCTNKT